MPDNQCDFISMQGILSGLFPLSTFALAFLKEGHAFVVVIAIHGQHFNAYSPIDGNAGIDPCPVKFEAFARLADDPLFQIDTLV